MFYSGKGVKQDMIPDLGRPTKAKLEKAMEGHVIFKAELIGLYQRK
jgi:hypothetical protein